MLILALGAAKYSTWSACDKSFGTMSAKLDRVFAVCQHKTEHHLYAQQQGMKIPNDGRTDDVQFYADRQRKPD